VGRGVALFGFEPLARGEERALAVGEAVARAEPEVPREALEETDSAETADEAAETLGD
jgi:hypothetical protein